MLLMTVFLAVAGCGYAGASYLYAESLIRPLLPGPGGFACFTGSYTGRSVDVDDWSKGKRVPTGHNGSDGQPAMRIEFEHTADVPVTALTLRLDYDDRKASYDWIFNFKLVAEAGPLGTLHAHGECPWYDRTVADGPGVCGTEANTFRLGCGIDCDGGSMSLTRAIGADALKLDFWEHGLLMRPGCGGGGRFRVKPAKSNPASLRLERAPAARCAALESKS
jgi:hypothetical protein